MQSFARITLRRLSYTLALAAFVLINPGFAATTKSDPFLDLREAFSKGDRKQFERLLPRLKGDPLAAYASYFDLRMRFDEQPVEAISRFLSRHEGEYVAEKLRGDWAKYLAKEGRWEEFSGMVQGLAQPDVELRCGLASKALMRGESGGIDEGLSVFASVKDLPDTCNDMARRLADAERLPPAAIWARAAWLNRAGRTAQIATTLRLLPSAQEPATADLALALNRPERYLGAVDEPAYGGQLIRIALWRLGRSDLTAAAGELERLGKILPADVAGGAWSDLGLQAAQRHDPRALAWFQAAGSATMTEESREWHVRAALRATDWPAVARAIALMPPTQRSEPAWRYWQARADHAAGRVDIARAIYTEIAGQPNFYGSLASEELGLPIQPPPRTRVPNGEEIAAATANTALQRSLSFFSRGLRLEGVREWNWGLRGMNDRQLLAAAEVAKRAEIFDRAISSADRTQTEHDYSVRFLAPFDDQVRPAASRQSLDDAWVYGLMRQESRFITDARSSAGASGLMQLMPATARWVAKKIGLKDYRHSKVNDAEVNLLLGTTYMRLVLESLDNHPVLASAGYNAGPGRAKRWRDPNRVLEGAIYAETIPFDETRDYVKKVMNNTVYYAVLFNGRPDSLKSRLGQIAPANGPDRTRELP